MSTAPSVVRALSHQLSLKQAANTGNVHQHYWIMYKTVAAGNSNYRKCEEEIWARHVSLHTFNSK